MNFIRDSLLTFRGIRAYRAFLKDSDRMPISDMNGITSKWMSKLLYHAHKNIPWYSDGFRKYGVKWGASDPFLELSKLPILTRAEVKANHSDFCWTGATDKGLKFATSGTSGEPLAVYTSPEQWIIEQGVIWRQWKWAGYDFRDRMAIFRSYAPKRGEPRFRVDRLRNWAYFSVFDMDDESISSYVAFLQSWKPRFLRGYPSALLLVAQHALKYGWKIPGLEAVFTASEALPPTLRETVRAAFSVEVFDHYGQAEITAMFHDCERHEGMHLDWEYGHVELVPTDEADVFRIIATNYHNYAMPLLRYDTGDLVEGGWQKCSCGRTSPVVRSIRGRMDDYIVSADGSRFSSVNFYTYFSKLIGIRRFQLVQNVPGELIVNLSTDETHRSDDVRTSLAHQIRSDLTSTSGLRVHVEYPVDFVQSREGKFATFIQRIGK